MTRQAPVKIPRRLAIIIVDASRERDYGWDSRDRTLGLGTLMGSVSQVTGDRYSYETSNCSGKFQRALIVNAKPLASKPAIRNQAKQNPYIVELHFSQLPTNRSSLLQFLAHVASASFKDSGPFVPVGCPPACRQRGIQTVDIGPSGPANQTGFISGPSVAAAKNTMQMTNP